MAKVKNEINDILLNTVSDLENKLEESREILSDIQSKMDSKVSEAKEYKVSVDDAKENIKRLESDIKSLENDLIELKEKYGKKNLVALIEAGTKEINFEIKKKHDEIQIHKNKIAELTNRARSIKDLLLNLKKDKKIKEERLNELENCTKYYKVRLEEIVEFAENHDDLEDYFIGENEEGSNIDGNVFEDIVGIDAEKEEIVEESETYDEVSIDEAEEVFNDVINPQEEAESDYENTLSMENEINDTEDDDVVNFEDKVEDGTDNPSDELVISETDELLSINEEENLEDTQDLQINDLLISVKQPIEESNKISNINKAIDEEFANIFGKDINEPVKNTIDIFGNEYEDNESNENDIVNKLTDIGLDYYSFTESDREVIKNNFNEQTISEIVNVLKEYKIQLDNIYVDGKILSSIAPAELSNIVSKLLNSGQSADAIGYVLDKLPLVDVKLLDLTIKNYGDYVKNVDITDIIVKSLKGDN